MVPYSYWIRWTWRNVLGWKRSCALHTLTFIKLPLAFDFKTFFFFFFFNSAPAHSPLAYQCWCTLHGRGCLCPARCQLPSWRNASCPGWAEGLQWPAGPHHSWERVAGRLGGCALSGSPQRLPPPVSHTAADRGGNLVSAQGFSESAGFFLRMYKR